MLERITSPEDLREDFDPGSFKRGLEYYRQGRVLSAQLAPRHDYDEITGRVRGSGSNVYQVYVRVEDMGLGVQVDGECSCPVGFNCKHVLCVVLHQLEHGRRVVKARAAGSPSHALHSWLHQLETSLTPPAPAPPAPGRPEHLLYLLAPQEGPSPGWPALRVEVVRCRQLKAGGYGKPSPVSLQNIWHPNPPGYITGEDVALLRRLAPHPFQVPQGPLPLNGQDGARMLRELLATGRCHWQDKDGPALSPGKPRSAQPQWTLGEDGLQRLVFATDPPASAVLALAPPHYVDLEAGRCGPIDSTLEPAVAGALAAAPALDPESARAAEKALKQRFPRLGLPRPRPLQVRASRPKPVPILRLGVLDPGPQTHPFLFLTQMSEPPATASLSFSYKGHQTPAGAGPEKLLVKDGEKLLSIQRNTRAEQQAAGRLHQAGLQPLSRQMLGLAPEQSRALAAPEPRQEAQFWLQFQSAVVPELLEDGWQIEIDEDFPYRLHRADEWYGELEESSGGDWFDLDLGVLVDGQRVALLPLLAQWLSTGRARRMQELAQSEDDAPLRLLLEDESWLEVPAGRVRPILETLLELHDPQAGLHGDKLRLPALRAAQLEELAGPADAAARLRWLGGERVRELGQRLREFDGLAQVRPPAGFKATLRPYQRQGLAWLQFLREYGLGGVLADDMGLGKTVQTLAHVLTEKRARRADRPSLVVAPTSLMPNWRLEAERFAPKLRVLTLHGPQRGQHFDSLRDYDLILTTYALLPRDRETLLGVHFHMLILDEAQNIKNPKSQAAQVAQQLEARHRLCLTGTPMENHLGELWSLFHFLQPGLLGDERVFRRVFRTPIEREGDTARQGALTRRTAPFMLRRSKAQVAAELPPKTEITREVELGGPQRDLYEGIRVAMQARVRQALAEQGLERSRIVVLDALLKLRQACCDPRLVKLARARRVHESAKLRLLMDMLPEMAEEGRRVLLFSQFATMLGFIETELSRAGLPYVKLTGRTRDRETPITRFQGGEVPVFLISLKAGGTGLNLTAADTVIHYDPWWNPAVETQATDRAHRLGQDKPVFVYRLITAGTVEEKITALQARKRALAEALFAEAPNAANLTRADLESLFEPL